MTNRELLECLSTFPMSVQNQLKDILAARTGRAFFPATVVKPMASSVQRVAFDQPPDRSVPNAGVGGVSSDRARTSRYLLFAAAGVTLLVTLAALKLIMSWHPRAENVERTLSRSGPVQTLASRPVLAADTGVPVLSQEKEAVKPLEHLKGGLTRPVRTRQGFRENLNSGGIADGLNKPAHREIIPEGSLDGTRIADIGDPPVVPTDSPFFVPPSASFPLPIGGGPFIRLRYVRRVGRDEAGTVGLFAAYLEFHETKSGSPVRVLASSITQFGCDREAQCSIGFVPNGEMRQRRLTFKVLDAVSMGRLVAYLSQHTTKVVIGNRQARTANP
jgi:hypothetical protein